MTFDAVLLTLPLLVTPPIRVVELENATSAWPTESTAQPDYWLSGGLWLDWSHQLGNDDDSWLLSLGADAYRARYPSPALDPFVVDVVLELGVRTYASRPHDSEGGTYIRLGAGLHSSAMVAKPWTPRGDIGVGGHGGLGGSIPVGRSELRLEGRLGATLRFDSWEHELVAAQGSYRFTYYPGEVGISLVAGWSPRLS